MEQLVATRLSVLGHPRRLAILRLLVRRYPDRVPAGEIAEALDVRPSTLSAYLGALMQAGLVTQARTGTSLRYSVDMTEMRRTLDYLLLDCCRGRPELCPPGSGVGSGLVRRGADRRYGVLFVCTGNSARSILAEAILRDFAGDRFAARSGGTHPASRVDPRALEVLAAKGHDVSGLRPKSLDEIRGQSGAEGEARPDFVFTVCNRAANEDCPPWAGSPVGAHWGVPDPAEAAGTDSEKRAAYERAYEALRDRILAFAALPIATLDRAELQRAVDEIARRGTEVPA